MLTGDSFSCVKYF